MSGRMRVGLVKVDGRISIVDYN